MTAPHHKRAPASLDLNHLRRGDTYRATTRNGIACGEYLGMEAPHGDRAILLRHVAGTASIALRDVTSILPTAA
jgi:hypothetical protein